VSTALRGRLLLLAASASSSTTPALVQGLRQVGADVEVLESDTHFALQRALVGDPNGAMPSPDAVLMELTDSSGLLPVERVRHIEWAELGSRARPVMALIHERHLALPELTTLVDDFLLPPYRPSEVLARLELIRRRRGMAAGHAISFGSIEVDLAERQVHVSGSGEPLLLTPREYDLLAYLAVHRGTTFSRKALLEHVWGRSYEGGPRTVDIHIRRLREKLPPADGDWIETIRHVGYRLRASDKTRPRRKARASS
jgi:DNA-binding response OmpR family regulator